MKHYGWNQIWRLFLIQTSRNRRAVDGLGFFHVISPALRYWADDEAERRAIAKRHFAYFNANPIVASFVVGAIDNLEERRRRGEAVTDRQIQMVKDTLSSVSTTMGDIFFNVVLIPLGLTIGSIFAIYGSYIGLALFLALYNYYHIRIRIDGYRKGLCLGEGVGREHVTRLFREQSLLGGCAAFAAGAFSALVISRAFSRGGLRLGLWGVGLMVATIVLRRRFSLFWSVLIVFMASSLYMLLW